MQWFKAPVPILFDPAFSLPTIGNDELAAYLRFLALANQRRLSLTTPVDLPYRDLPALACTKRFDSACTVFERLADAGLIQFQKFDDGVTLELLDTPTIEVDALAPRSGRTA